MAAIVLLALSLRACNLGWPPLWADEAESAINALTIVAEGVPTDRHLGLPLYENTLVRPWPESAEYEFRDISYSDRGLAVYHGWIPLYAIAAAFRLAGVTPEEARRTTPPRDAGIDELAWWTEVPRWPALVFSVIFVLAAFALGRATGGDPAGFAFAFGGSVANVFIWWGRQARYYSATLAGSALSGLLVWRAVVRGRLSDHVLAGLGIGLLFHVHALSAVTMALVYVAALPLALKQPRLWLRVLVAGSASGIVVLPWAAWSGLIGHTAYLPAARQYLDLGILIATLPTTNPVVLGTALGGVAWLALAWVLGPRLGERWRRPILEEARPLRFALAWLLLAYAVFVGLVPAASYFVGRLQLAVAVPGLLVVALVLTAAARALRPSWPALPSVGMAALLALAGQLPPRLPGTPDGSFAAFVQRIRSLDVGENGRLLATPNAHLQLTYYTGRPVQSLAPLRREWLEAFAAPLVVIESAGYESVPEERVADVARRLGIALSPGQARARGQDMPWVVTVVDLEDAGIPVVSAPRPLDALDRALVEDARNATRDAIADELRAVPLPRPFKPSNWQEFWHGFFYWFAGAEERRGARLNYASCRASARAEVDDVGFVVVHCPVHPSTTPPSRERD